MILLLSGIWDLRPHIAVNVVSTKEIFLKFVSAMNIRSREVCKTAKRVFGKHVVYI
jgi:hypothetical protein